MIMRVGGRHWVPARAWEPIHSNGNCVCVFAFIQFISRCDEMFVDLWILN